MSTPVLTHNSVRQLPSLGQAYAVCRGIARREAKNFYYAFLALPAAKRDAICAVYAFMRQADDLADDESQPHHARLRQIEAWSAAWREAVERGSSSDPVFIALADARVRFAIPLSLLDQLVQGTTMDLALAPNHSGGPDTYPTFDDLYRYCYLVASVVGLVCIRIFGYANPLAEQLAEELGIAFQLTNILRDVREDAERGRIYLPLADLAAHKLSIEAILQAAATKSPHPAPSELRSLLAFEALRAERFYLSGRSLLPLIAPDSRPALWVLITIYHRLLQRITRARFDVFSSRISVPALEKLAILGVGLARVLWARALGRIR